MAALLARDARCLPNPVYHQTCVFAAGDINPLTGFAYPYRCWHELAYVLVAGGAKYCPTTSAQIESVFTGLTRHRVTKLQHAALQELTNAQVSRWRLRVQVLEESAEPAPRARILAATVAGLHQPLAHRPASGATQICTDAYDTAHRVLATARSLAFSTETSGTAGCVLNLGWVLVDANGSELVSYNRLWRLPPGDHIHKSELRVHGISEERLQHDGVDAKPELAELFALVSEALAAEVRVAAHDASFCMARLHHTAAKHKLHLPLRSADMLCTMHEATRHCELRARGSKRLTAPRKEELYRCLFDRAPPGPLHTALADCRMTVACLVEGVKRKCIVVVSGEADEDRRSARSA